MDGRRDTHGRAPLASPGSQRHAGTLVSLHCIPLPPRGAGCPTDASMISAGDQIDDLPQVPTKQAPWPEGRGGREASCHLPPGFRGPPSLPVTAQGANLGARGLCSQNASMLF